MNLRNALPEDCTLAPHNSDAGVPQRASSHCCDHFVQFYHDDSFLVESVADFMMPGLKNGEAAIVIATANHRSELERSFGARGLDVAKAVAEERLWLLDAQETLSKFMADERSDAARFEEVTGCVMARAGAGGRKIRAFGEMVALLWDKGQGDAAIQLEQLWNELGKKFSFSLFCAYPMASFTDESSSAPFLKICNTHTRVIPAESFDNAGSEPTRLREITKLQQRAQALEQEVERRKEIERIIALRERELRDFLENATESIHQVGPDGTILWANNAELEFLGYKPEEYIGRNITEFHADQDVINDILGCLLRGEELHDYEARLRHKDGSIRYVAINSNVYRENGEFIYTRCFTRDITARKQATELLEQTVAERTQQLRETIAELEAFSYSISHDMRSPLRAMQGYAKMIIDDHGAKLPDDALLRLQSIERAANRLDALIRDVLLYSTLGKTEMNLHGVDLNQLLEDLLQQRPEFKQRGHTIQVDSGLPEVLGHPACLSQCLGNLIENALKFVAAGTVPLVRVHASTNNDAVRICVTDNGIGIAPEHYERIFQIFGRVYSEKTYPGTGIGLAVVKKAISRMGGQAGFTSEPGSGTTFWLELPKYQGSYAN